MNTPYDELEPRLRASLERHAADAPRTDLTMSALHQAGRIRFRRRASASVAAVAVVALAIPLGGRIVGDANAPTPPATQSPETRTPTSSPPNSTEPSIGRIEIVAEPLLRDEDVNPIGTYRGFALNDSASLAQGYEELVCLPRLATSGATTQALGAWFSQGNEGSFFEAVLQMDGVSSAQRLVDGQRSLPDQCYESIKTHEQTVTQPTPIDVDGADEALVWTVDDRPLPSDPGSSPSFGGVVMARTSNVVVVLTFRAMGDPTEDGWATYGQQTMATALDRALR